MFYRSQDGWELAGILYAVTPTVGGLITSGQPEDTAVFGNFTAMADLSIYREQIEEIISPRPALRAGDADQDGDFDNLDIVQVLQRAKYLTGQLATWGDGDWNGAPGGSAGNPPLGDGLFNQLDIIAALNDRPWYVGPYAVVRGEPAALTMRRAGAGEHSVAGFRRGGAGGRRLAAEPSAFGRVGPRSGNRDGPWTHLAGLPKENRHENRRSNLDPSCGLSPHGCRPQACRTSCAGSPGKPVFAVRRAAGLGARMAAGRCQPGFDV